MATPVELEEIRAAAARVFRGDQAARAFLELRSPALGGVPAELVKAGRGDEVLRFLERLAAEAPPPPASIFGIPLRWGKKP
jgi:hypothetical protein